MGKGLNLPPDDYFSEWLQEDSYVVKHTTHPVYFISRHDQKIRRVKHHLENYMFVTGNGTDFMEVQFKSMLSVHLNLTYEFQLLKVDHNRFLLTLETAMPTDYAFAILEDGRMINIDGSNVLHYPTDEYGEGYLGGDLDYGREIKLADVQILVQIHALTLHIWTIRAVERILQPYCAVHTIDASCLLSKTVSCVSSSCWARRGTIFPKFIILKVCSKHSHEPTMHSSVSQKHIQTYCVSITVKLHGSACSIPKFKLRHEFPFARAVQSDRVGCCFLRDVDVGRARITELHSSIVLRPKQVDVELTVHDIAEKLRSLEPCTTSELVVQSIGVSGYIARSTRVLLPQLLEAIVGANKDIQICSQPLSWVPWSTSLDGVNESLAKKISIRTTAMPTEFYNSAVLEDLLSPFCMFDKDGYHPGSSPDIYQYMSIVWTEKTRSIPSLITVYAAPPCCRTTLDPVNGEVVPLSVMTTYNTGDGLEAHD